MGDGLLPQDHGPLGYWQARAVLNVLIADARRKPGPDLDDDPRPSAAELEGAVEAVRDLAPDEPTAWWPGGWLGRPIDGVSLLGRMPSGHPVRGTELEAVQDRPEGFGPEEWTAEWIPTLPLEVPRPDEFAIWDDLLDVQSWLDLKEDGRVREIPGPRPCEVVGEAVVWVLMAAASGMIGSGAYDAVKAAVAKFRQRKSRGERDSAQNASASAALESADGETPADPRCQHDRALRPLDIDIPEVGPPILGLDASDP